MVRFHCFQQSFVLYAGTYGDTEAVTAEGDTVAVPHDDTTVYQVVVDGHRISDAHQHKVGIRGEHLFYYGELAQTGNEQCTLLLQTLHPALHLVVAMYHVECLALCEEVNVVGILDFAHDTHNLWRGKGHS